MSGWDRVNDIHSLSSLIGLVQINVCLSHVQVRLGGREYSLASIPRVVSYLAYWALESILGSIIIPILSILVVALHCT